MPLPGKRLLAPFAAGLLLTRLHRVGRRAHILLRVRTTIVAEIAPSCSRGMRIAHRDHVRL